MIAAASLAGGHAYAGPSGGSQPACTPGDVTLTIGSTNYVPDACKTAILSPGNGSSQTANMNGGFGTSFTFLASSDGSASSGIQGIAFTVKTPDSNDTSGIWHISWQDTNGSTSLNLPITISLEVGLFGGATGDGYKFDTPAPATLTSHFSTTAVRPRACRTSSSAVATLRLIRPPTRRPCPSRCRCLCWGSGSSASVSPRAAEPDGTSPPVPRGGRLEGLA